MKTSLRTLAPLLFLAACGGNGGGTDAGHVGPGEACTEIIEHCHTIDTGTGPAAECHDLGHDGPADMCEARLEECIEICDAVTIDGGPPDACDELGHLCHAADTGSGPAHDCHELGHGGDVAACEAMLASCTAICAVDAGEHDHDGGIEDAGEHDHDGH